MNVLRAELSANFETFTASWKAELPVSVAALDTHSGDFLKSYARIASLNAWRTNVLEDRISEGSGAFFGEALNDAIISHVFARIGSWRSALSALRSSIENACFCIYYKDHPVELRQWEAGSHRLSFSEVHNYLERHPDVSPLKGDTITGMALVREEYSVLSRAVHGSGKTFRMSPGAQGTTLWKADVAAFGAWKTREQRTLCGINLLLTTIFRKELRGAGQVALRRALAFAIPTASHARVKSALKVTLVTV